MADINECDECRHNCAANAVCYDLDPHKHDKAYHCQCPQGKTGEMCTENISPKCASTLGRACLRSRTRSGELGHGGAGHRRRCGARTGRSRRRRGHRASTRGRRRSHHRTRYSVPNNKHKPTAGEEPAAPATGEAKSRRRKRSVNRLKNMDYDKLEPQYKFDYCKNEGPKAFKSCHKVGETY